MAPLFVWTVSAGIGALIAVLNLVDAYRDLRALEPGSNGRLLIARGWVRAEAIRFAIQLTWAGIGIAALLNPRPAPLSPIVLLLIGTNLALALNTILDARERIVLRRILQ